jgi:hypothetical protein
MTRVGRSYDRGTPRAPAPHPRSPGRRACWRCVTSETDSVTPIPDGSHHRSAATGSRPAPAIAAPGTPSRRVAHRVATHPGR